MGVAAGLRTTVYFLTAETAPTFAAIRSKKSRDEIVPTALDSGAESFQGSRMIERSGFISERGYGSDPPPRW